MRPLPAFTDTVGSPTAEPTEDLSELRDLDPGQFPAGLGLDQSRPIGLVRWLQRHWLATAAGLILLAAVAGAVWFLRRRQSALLRDSDLVARLFGMLEIWAHRLHVPWPASHTALEHADEFGRRLPEGAPAVQRLAGLFVAQRYGRQPPTREALAETADDWKRIEPFFWRRWLRRALRP